MHVFCNTASPAVANYGVRKAVENADHEVRDYVENHFYVDDGLISCTDPNQASDLIKRTQHELIKGHIRLHKITSDCKQVLTHFDNEDLAKNIVDLDLESDNWNLLHDVVSYLQ